MNFATLLMTGPTFGKPQTSTVTPDGQRILDHLEKHGTMTTKHIMQDLGISCSHHLYRLEKDGLIVKEVKSSITAARASWWRLNNV